MMESILDVKGIPEEVLDVEVSLEDKIREKSYSERGCRYHNKTKELDGIAGHYARMRNQVKVQVEYIISLAEELSENYKGDKSKIVQRSFTQKEEERLRDLYRNFEVKDVMKINALDDKIHHDIVAMNTWITYMCENGEEIASDVDFKRLVHYGLTSADITTNAQSLVVKNVLREAYLPNLLGLQDTFIHMVEEWGNSDPIVMAGRTHKQYAEHTLLKKKISNIIFSLNKHLEDFIEERGGEEGQYRMPGKIGGAIGNNVEIQSAYPDHDWRDFQRKFLEERLGLKRELMTDQDHDNIQMLNLFNSMVLANKRLIKFFSDFREYCGRRLFNKKTSKEESGSSVMSQKVNPWRIEGAERKLRKFIPALRMFEDLMIYDEEGDLRRSRLKREIGDVFSHALIGYKSAIEGFSKYFPVTKSIKEETEAHPEMFSAIIQTILRREGVSDAYDRIKELTMGREVSSQVFVDAVDKLCEEGRVSKEVRRDIVDILLDSEKATGDAEEVSNKTLDEAKRTINRVKQVWNIS